jgi:hypothetical protein
MITAFQILKKAMNRADFALLLKAGIIPVSVVDRYCYYQKYLDYIEEGQPKTTAAEFAAEDFGLKSITSIYDAKKFFEAEFLEVN